MIGERDKSILEKVQDTDEPVIVFRARDPHSVNVIQAYFDDVSFDANVTREFVEAVENRLAEFREWQYRNSEKLKSPDL
jgi:hypothetical protein